MWAAVRLRLAEASRRGGWMLLVAGAAGVFWVAAFGDDTVKGRYALATDLAVTLGYVAAIFFGALPLAADREKKRALLPSASPVAPWQWAFGNAIGSGLAVAGATGLFCFAAAAGTGVAGGIPTHRTSGWKKIESASGRKELAAETVWITRPMEIEVKEGVERIRFSLRTAPKGDLRGTESVLRLKVGDTVYEGPIGHPLEARVSGPGRVRLENLTPGLHLGIVTSETRALHETRSFVANGALAAVGPALGAAALAAVATAAGALFTGPVAALLAALVLLLASMKGFLVDVAESQGPMGSQTHGAPAASIQPSESTRDLSGDVIVAVLTLLPDLHEFSGIDRVARGEWNGLRGAGPASISLLVAWILATVLGGYGVYSRRLA